MRSNLLSVPLASSLILYLWNTGQHRPRGVSVEAGGSLRRKFTAITQVRDVLLDSMW